MSSSFFVKVGEAPLFETVIEALHDETLRCVEASLDELTGPWIDEGALHFYQHGTSTRSVEVAYAGGEMTVRVLAMSSPDVYELAFRLTEIFGGDGEVRHEELGAMPAKEARTRLGDEWMVHDIAVSHAAIVTAVRDNPHHHVEIQGALQGVKIGKKMLDRLGDDPVAMLEAVRRVQYIEDSHKKQMPLPFTNLGKGTRCTPWALDAAGWYGTPTHLGLQMGDDYKFLTIEEARGAAGEAWLALDETQFAIDAIPEDRRAAIRELVGKKGVGPKTWWQFWR